jgi:hypothetical protein
MDPLLAVPTSNHCDTDYTPSVTPRGGHTAGNFPSTGTPCMHALSMHCTGSVTCSGATTTGTSQYCPDLAPAAGAAASSGCDIQHLLNHECGSTGSTY